MDKLIGRVLLKQFRVESFIASGGMGAVYRVWDVKRSASLAMKVLHDDYAEDPVMFRRFQSEARALQSLAHPNIVPFYGLYQQAEVVFLLQQFVDGASLKDILRRRGGLLPSLEALAYLQAVSAALGYAHAKNIVHCDIKPGNVLVDRGGAIYLTDFGIARHLDSSTTTLASAGTPAYMAPEQILGHQITPASDVYALGALAFELLTGRRPFTGNEISDPRAVSTNDKLRLAHLRAEPPDPRAFNPKIPAPMAQTLLRALAKKPLDRFQDAGEFWQTLVAGISRPIPTRVPPLDLPAPVIPPAQSPSHPAPVGGVTTIAPVPTQTATQTWLDTNPLAWNAWLIPALLSLLVLGCFGIAAILAVNGGIFPSTRAVTPTETATLTPSATSSATWTPTATDAPTATPSITFEPTLTPHRLHTSTPDLPDAYPPTETPVPPSAAQEAHSEWISFHARTGSSQDIYLFNIFTGESQVLVADKYHEKNGTWSADGRYLVYEQAESSGRYFDVYVLDTYTQMTTRLTRQEGQCSNWNGFMSPDNQQIVFHSNCGIRSASNRALFVVNADGSGRRQISGDGAVNIAPQWSPDGRWIAFTQRIGENNRLYLVAPDGSNQRFVVGGCQVSFSPDSQWLYFSSLCASDSAIYKVRLDGSQLTRIGDALGMNPALSPDGRWISYQTGTNAIWLMESDGSNPRKLYEGRDTGVPAWRP